MKLSDALQAPLDDASWFSSCALSGLVFFGLNFVPIPVLGSMLSGMVAIGWMRAVYDRRLTGNVNLPPPRLSDVKRGLGPFAGVSLIVAGMALVACVGVFCLLLAAFSEDSESFLRIALYAFASLLLLSLLFIVLGPAFMLLHFRDGQAGGLGDAVDVVVMQPHRYASLLWVFLVSGVLGQLGIVCCLVGIVVTLPYSWAVQAIALADWVRAEKTGSR